VGTRIYRAAYLINNRIEACVYVSPRPDLHPSWLASLFAKTKIERWPIAPVCGRSRSRSARMQVQPVCSCFGVGRNTICAAIKKQWTKHPAADWAET